MAHATPVERFHTRYIVQDNGCWQWQGKLDRKGYGFFNRDRVTTGAHRAAWELLRGPIPEGLHIDHLCRNRACVNPGHLEPVTPKENVLRGVGIAAEFARRTHCVNGHELTEANAPITNPRYGRVCRTCQRERSAKSHARRKLTHASVASKA